MIFYSAFVTCLLCTMLRRVCTCELQSVSACHRVSFLTGQAWVVAARKSLSWTWWCSTVYCFRARHPCTYIALIPSRLYQSRSKTLRRSSFSESAHMGHYCPGFVRHEIGDTSRLLLPPTSLTRLRRPSGKIQILLRSINILS
jgi:hypothetical protein